MEKISHITPIILTAIIVSGLLLAYTGSPLLLYLRSPRIRLLVAILGGFAAGTIIADPEPFIEIAAMVLPLIIIGLYITVVLRLKRGLRSNELALLVLLIAGGVGYHAAKQDYATSLLFAVAYGTPVALSVTVHAMLHKYHDAAVLIKLRRTKLYRLLQTDITPIPPQSR